MQKLFNRVVIPKAFKLIQSAQKRWRRIRGFKLLAEVIEGVNFTDGLKVKMTEQQNPQQDAA